MRESEEFQHSWPHNLHPWPLNDNLPTLLFVISKAKKNEEKLNDGWEVNVETPPYSCWDSIWVSKEENAETRETLTCIPHTNKNYHASHIQTMKVQWTLDWESIQSVWQILIVGFDVEAPCPNKVQIYFLRIPLRIHANNFIILLANFWNLQDQ